MPNLTYAVILAAIWSPAGAIAATHFIPDCAGQVEIAHAHVVHVDRNGALVLDDGRAIVLEGIRLAGTDAAPQELAARALANLRVMAMAEPITFTAVPPEQDRYGRMRVQAFGGRWLQITLLEQGLARVAISPDRTECAPDLYEAEQRGRARHAGLWAMSDSAPRAPEAMKGAAAGSFQIVEGRVTNVGRNNGLVFIDFGGNGRRVFSAVIQPEDRRAFREFDLEGLATHDVRIRGIVQVHLGQPRIALSNPWQIEILDK
jgi:endonuclease YncB( thermonuclease family)